MYYTIRLGEIHHLENEQLFAYDWKNKPRLAYMCSSETMYIIYNKGKFFVVILLTNEVIFTLNVLQLKPVFFFCYCRFS